MAEYVRLRLICRQTESEGYKNCQESWITSKVGSGQWTISNYWSTNSTCNKNFTKLLFSNVSRLSLQFRTNKQAQARRQILELPSFEILRGLSIQEEENKDRGIIRKWGLHGATCFLLCLSNDRGMVNVLISTKEVGNFFVLCLDIWKSRTSSFSKLFGLILCFMGKL